MKMEQSSEEIKERTYYLKFNTQGRIDTDLRSSDCFRLKGLYNNAVK